MNHNYEIVLQCILLCPKDTVYCTDMTMYFNMNVTFGCKLIIGEWALYFTEFATQPDEKYVRACFSPTSVCSSRASLTLLLFHLFRLTLDLIMVTGSWNRRMDCLTKSTSGCFATLRKHLSVFFSLYSQMCYYFLTSDKSDELCW